MMLALLAALAIAAIVLRTINTRARLAEREAARERAEAEAAKEAEIGEIRETAVYVEAETEAETE